MSLQRAPELQRLLDLTEAAVHAGAGAARDVLPIADKVFTALRHSDEIGCGEQRAVRLPVCEHFGAAIEVGRKGPPGIRELAGAFADLEPQLAWHVRPGSEQGPGDFAERHANAVIIGDRGLEYSDVVRIGTSLVAPNTDYPRHRHAPEEFYVVISPGAWMRDDKPLQARAVGDIVHNPPNAWHAMRAGQLPLLAIWCLWTGDA